MNVIIRMNIPLTVKLFSQLTDGSNYIKYYGWQDIKNTDWEIFLFITDETEMLKNFVSCLKIIHVRTWESFAGTFVSLLRDFNRNGEFYTVRVDSGFVLVLLDPQQFKGALCSLGGSCDYPALVHLKLPCKSSARRCLKQ